MTPDGGCPKCLSRLLRPNPRPTQQQRRQVIPEAEREQTHLTSGATHLHNSVSENAPVRFVGDPSNDNRSEHLRIGKLATGCALMQTDFNCK